MKRWTRIFAPALALAVVFAAGLAALGNSRAGAQPASSAPAAVVAQTQPQQPLPTAEPAEGTETPDALEGPETPDANEANEPAEDPAAEAAEAAALASKATISEQQAIDAALAAHPGTTMVKVSLDDENGLVVYSVELSNGADVKVDATTGQIASTDQGGEHEDANEVEHEGAELPATPAQP
jgi:hypothetical protein